MINGYTTFLYTIYIHSWLHITMMMHIIYIYMCVCAMILQYYSMLNVDVINRSIFFVYILATSTTTKRNTVTCAGSTEAWSPGFWPCCRARRPKASRMLQLGNISMPSRRMQQRIRTALLMVETTAMMIKRGWRWWSRFIFVIPRAQIQLMGCLAEDQAESLPSSVDGFFRCRCTHLFEHIQKDRKTSNILQQVSKTLVSNSLSDTRSKSADDALHQITQEKNSQWQLLKVVEILKMWQDVADNFMEASLTRLRQLLQNVHDAATCRQSWVGQWWGLVSFL